MIYVSDGDTQHTFLDADDTRRTGREVTYYAYGSDEAETMIVDSRTDVNPGFYTQSGTNGEAVQLLRYSSNTVVSGQLNSMSSNGNYATMVGVEDSNRELIDFNFTGALVVDVADSGYASLTAIERALRNGETFFLSFTYDSDYAVETVYIQSVKSADVTLDSMTLTVGSGAPTEPTYYTDAPTALANAIAVTDGQTLSLNVAASDDDATVTVEYRTDFSSGGRWTAGTSFAAVTDTNAFRVTVTAADGVTSAQYFVYFDVTAGT